MNAELRKALLKVLPSIDHMGDFETIDAMEVIRAHLYEPERPEFTEAEARDLLEAHGYAGKGGWLETLVAACEVLGLYDPTTGERKAVADER